MNEKTVTSTSHSYESDRDAFISRMDILCELAGNASLLAKAAGVSEGVIRKWRAGDSEPKVSNIFALAAAVDVSAAWLLTGEGNMRTGAEADAAESDGDYDYVTLYDAECSAGNGSWNEYCRPLTQLAFTKYSLRKKGLDAATLSAIRVTGDSMEGDLADGDAVLIDHSKQDVKADGIYVIRLDGHLYAKRLQRTFDGVDIISTNKAYPPISVPKSRLGELDVIGQVVWAASWMI